MRNIVKIVRDINSKIPIELQEDAREGEYKDSNYVDIFNIMIDNDVLRECCKGLFADKHYAQSVEEAYKLLNQIVRNKAGRRAVGKDGAEMMFSVFNIKNPVLRFNKMRTESEINQQNGYCQIIAGAMTGIRNPRAHTPKHLDNPKIALELLVLANHVIRMVEKSIKTRKKT